MDKNRYYILAFLLLCLGINSNAQPPNSNKSKVEAVKIGFITEQIGLSSSQAAQFWPIYNEYNAKKKEIKSKILSQSIETNPDAMSDEAIIEDIKLLQTYRQQEVNLDKEYFEKFQKVISLKQIAKLYKAEREFTKILLKKLEEK
jgi:hypothetical protein